MKAIIFFWISLIIAGVAAQSMRGNVQPLDITYENYSYPYPVNFIELSLQGQPAKMAYMDIMPAQNENGTTVLLLHGRNFFGAYWQKTIRHLVNQGYRVVVPDQVGFGKSSKPSLFFSFHLLSENLNVLLDTLNISKVAVVGHSMGGTLAVRFALMFPDRCSHLVLENPIGLEEYRLKVPHLTIEEHYRRELEKTEHSIRNYHRRYYVAWRDEFDQYVQAQYRVTLNSEYPRVAWVNALISEMIYTQPVVCELSNLKVPTLLIIGEKDRTAAGKDLMHDQVKSFAGQYPAFGKQAAGMIPNAKLVTLKNAAHVPHLEVPVRFNSKLTEFIRP